MFQIARPTPAQAQDFIQSQQGLSHSYAEVGHTRTERDVPGYDNDLNFEVLGQGARAWQAAKRAIRQWQMFPNEWAFIAPAEAPIEPGQVVAMAARVLGFWWLNACRIVYVIDNEHQFGFAYGTLPGHVERGEELFLVEKDADGRVRYVIRAFSKPRYWMARVGYPIARAHQRKFVRDSKAAMLRFVQKNAQ
jgi:uncharacterized protein (UPF0548 family)